MVDTRTIVQAINYILKKTGKIDKLKIVKLVYLADKMHLILYGRTITGDSYCVMKNGPVGSTTLDILNENLEFLEDSDIEYSRKYLSKVPLDSKLYEATNVASEYDFLSESDQTVLDRIITLFSKKSSLSLVELTHKYPEWKQYESEFMNQTRKHADIRVDELFSAIENDPLGIDPAQLQCSKEIFLGRE